MKSSDPGIQSVSLFPDQCLQAWQESQEIIIPQDYSEVRRVIVCGMGGSALGPELIRSVFYPQMKVDFHIQRDYLLPFDCGEDSLVILSSYSGNTEEILSCAEDVKKKKNKVFVVTSGGKLLDWAKKENKPYYLIDPRYNPSHQPRLALGYSCLAILACLSKCGLVSFNFRDLDEILLFLRQRIPCLSEEAEIMAKDISSKIPFLLGANHLSGAVHTVSNCLNENSKIPANYFILPEFNHHLLEGFSFPHNLNQQIVFLSFFSSLFSNRIQKRFRLTQQIMEEQGFSWFEFKPLGQNFLSQSFEVIIWGAFLSLFLAKLNQIDPLDIPFVQNFKLELNR